MSRVSLEVNGTHYETEVEPRLLLADLLRDRLDLTGTHLGCEHGVCGSCTVQIDGKPARSCLTLAVQADRCSIRTVEGLAQPQDGLLHPLQRAFHEHHALQCGYCTPGFLMSMEWLLPDLAGLTDGEVRELLAGNLCRCTGYQNIVAATQAAASDLVSRRHAMVQIVVDRELRSASQSDRAWAALEKPDGLLAAAGVSAVVGSPDRRSRGRVVAGQIPIEGSLELVDLDDDQRVANFEIRARELDGPGHIRGALQVSLRGSRLVIQLDLRFTGTSASLDQKPLRTMIEKAAEVWIQSLADDLEARGLESPDPHLRPGPALGLVAVAVLAGVLWLVREVRRRRG